MAWVVEMQRNHVFKDIQTYFEESQSQSLNLFMDTYNEVKWEMTHPDSRSNQLSRELQSEFGFSKMESNALGVILENLSDYIAPSV